jgi:teichoic acid transport system permease protein
MMKFEVDFRQLTIFANLVQSDFRRRYLGTYFGIFWAFAAPFSTIAVLLFVFNVGFRSGPINGVSFDLWLISGLIVWFYISDAIVSGTNSVVEYSFLVKKIPFSTELLPIVKIASSLYVHVVNLLLLLGLFIYHGHFPSIFWLQIIYYLIALVIFVLAISMIGAVIQVFFRDFQGVITILMQIGLWGTPVLWDAKILPERFAPLVNLNPASYIVQGYRDSLLFNTWFFERPGQTLYFWAVTISLLVLGIFVFKRAKRDFADVL